MSNAVDNMVKTITKAIDNSHNKKTAKYETMAEVTHVDGDTVWVHIPGGVQETPVKKTIDAKKGDTVKVSISKTGSAIIGNTTAPPTDDTKANHATNIAFEAQNAADSAEQQAKSAKIAADTAWGYADDAYIAALTANQSAIEANNQAISATNSANNALGQLGVVENVVDTLTWIAEHSVFELTTDTSVVASKTYYVPNNQTLTMTDGSYQVSGLTIFIKDGIVTVNGTATADVYFELGIPSVTAGEKIYISGASGGSFQTYGLRYYQAGGSVFVYDGVKKTTAVNNAKYSVYVANGYTTTDLIFYPRVSNANDGYEYAIVDSPTGNPSTQGYFELDTDDAVKTYVQTHLALMNDGLFVVKDNNGYKVKIDNNGMYVQNPSGREVAEFSSTAARIGLTTAARFLMGASSLQAYNSSNQKYFEVSANGLTFGTNTAATSTDVTNAISTASADATSKANAAQSAAEATASADATTKANAAQSAAEKVATNYLSYDATNGLDIRYTGTNNRVNIKGDGMTVYANNVDVAKFGTSARIGQDGSVRTELKDGALYIYGASSNKIAQFGWGEGIDSSGGLSDGAFLTFGGRVTGSSIGNFSTALGAGITASGFDSHAEGMETQTIGPHSHAEGRGSKAYGHGSHAEGLASEAHGDYSHAGGSGTIANGNSQTVIGKYNKADTTSLFIIGKGSSNNSRDNALEVEGNGSVNIASGAKYKINGTNLAASDVGALASSDVYGMFSVSGVNIASADSLAAGDYKTYTYTYARSGYYPLCVARINSSGSNSTFCSIIRYGLTSQSVGSCDISVTVRNVASSSAATLTLAVYVLWVKTS